jgi:hypothetical protein
MSTVEVLRLVWVAGLIASLCSTRAQSAPTPCASSDRQIASIAQSDADGTLQAVLNFINGDDQETQALLTKWFGRKDKTTVDTVSGVFVRSRRWLSTVSFYCLYQNDGSMTADVTTPAGVISVDVSGGLFAYVDPTDLTKVYLGLRFFKAPGSTGYDSKLGTLIHEMTHFWITGNTNSAFQDIYNKADCLRLAANDSEKALKNAQNYEYFVEDWLRH